MDEIFDAVNNVTINNVGCELNRKNASDAQANLASGPGTVTHNRNVTVDQNLLSCRTIGEVSVLIPPTNPRIAEIELAPQMLLMPVVQEIFTDTASDNAWKNRNQWRISRTGVGGSTPIYNQVHGGIRKTSTPDSIDINRTRIPIGTSGTSTASPAEYLKSPGIGNK